MWDRGTAETLSKKALKDDGYIPCHETYDAGQPKQAVCRGFWDVHQKDVLMLRLANAMEFTKFVNIKES